MSWFAGRGLERRKGITGGRRRGNIAIGGSFGIRIRREEGCCLGSTLAKEKGEWLRVCFQLFFGRGGRGKGGTLLRVRISPVAFLISFVSIFLVLEVLLAVAHSGTTNLTTGCRMLQWRNRSVTGKSGFCLLPQRFWSIVIGIVQRHYHWV